jgi:hypothetical protein
MPEALRFIPSTKKKRGGEEKEIKGRRGESRGRRKEGNE